MNKHVKILLTLKSLGFAFLFSIGLVAHAAVDNGDVNPASTTAMQQSKKISGIITDEKGEPIIGANIAVVGTTIGIISDMDGKYELEVPEGAEVKVSYIG